MGRRKITIKQIPDVKLRHITFNKRKNGLFKKAAELSVLCNLNLLLVCEDGLGNLIQFSRNKIPDIKNFLSQCNYQNVVDLTSEDYPDFARINRKKDKDKDEKEEESESAQDEEDEHRPQQHKDKNARTFVELNSQHNNLNPNTRKPPMNQPVTFETRTMSQRQKNGKSLNLNLSVPENLATGPSNGESDSVQKKSKNKLGLRLKIPKAEGAEPQENASQAQAHAQSQHVLPEEPTMKAPLSNMESSGMPMDRLRRQADYGPLRTMEKPMDFASSPFMPFMDPLKRFNGVYEQMASPFKFYGQNPRMETLSTMFKGYSPFTFPLSGTPLVPKSNVNDDEKLLDAASAMKYMNSRGVMGPETANSMGGSHKVFTFQADDSVPNINQINQMASRNDFALANQRAMYSQGQMPNQVNDYINLPSVMKSDLDFEMNMPPDTLSARRFGFNGYFNEFDGDAFNDMRKKHKMSS